MAAAVTLLVLCWAFRPSCTVSTPEWFHNISTSLFNLSGDIMLGGLFSINELTSNLSQRMEPDNISCRSLNYHGLGLAMVMKYAVDEINANQILLPGIKLGYEIHDTCRQSAVVVKPTLSFLTAKSDKVLSPECNYTNYETSVSAVIGPYRSEMVSVIGKLLGFFLMPQISFGATSGKFSDKLLFPSFFRTVPSDKGQVEAMVLLLKEFHWNWVAVVGSEEEYGIRGVKEFSKIAANNSVCVAYQGLIPVYSDPEPVIETIINNIIATNVGVIVVFSVVEQVEVFFKEVITRNVTGVWIASTSWAIHTRVTSLPNIQTVGTIIGFTYKVQTLDLLTAYTQQLFVKVSEGRAHTAPPAPDSSYPLNPCPQCWNLSPANISLMTEPVLQRTAFSVYAAIYSVAQALHNLLGCNSTACLQGPETKIYPWKLLEALRNTSVDINGTLLVFDSNGDPNIGYNLVEWLWNASGVDFIELGSFYEKLDINMSLFKWHTPDSEAPRSSCSAACKPGQVRRVKGFHSCCFDCIDCLPGTYQAHEGNAVFHTSLKYKEHFEQQFRKYAFLLSLRELNERIDTTFSCLHGEYKAAASALATAMLALSKEAIQCTECPRGQWSTGSSTNCTEPTFEVLSWDTPEALAMMLGGVLMLVCQGSVGAVFLKHRETPLVEASGGTLCFVALLSLTGACLSLLLFLGKPGDTVCYLQLPLTSIFQTVAISIITSISLRIFYVSEFPKMAASHPRVLRGPGSWLFVLVCCAAHTGICCWFALEGPSLSAHLANMKIDFVRAFLSCQDVLPLSRLAIIQGFNVALALVSFICSFMAVKHLHQYNLARDITFSSLIYGVIWETFIPVYIAVCDKYKTIVHASYTLVSIFALMAAYYFPKCYLLLRKPELNTADHFCTFLEGVPPTPAQEEPQTQTESEHCM